MDDTAKTNNIRSALAGGQIGHAITNHNDAAMLRYEFSADKGFAVTATGS
jgi:hypothetical protein